ncbi:MAG: hypothetical protein WBP85_04485 [Terracidiphilus sp.]
MASSAPNQVIAQSRSRITEIVRSYFYWSYPRGAFHYDVMVTLILLFIFLTPHLWDYGAKPPLNPGPVHPMQVVGSGRYVVVTVQAADVDLPADASYPEVKKALRQAIEPVMGDAVSVEKWQTVTDAQGHLLWKIWARR